MSPLLLHSNTNQYNINGLLCTYTEMFRIQTCCNHILSAAEGFLGQEATCSDQGICQFYLVLSLFYSLKRGSNGFIDEKLYIYFTKDPEAVHYIPGGGGGGGGGVQLFPGGEVQMLISIETRIRTCYFLGGCPDPHIPLWIRTWAMSS